MGQVVQMPDGAMVEMPDNPTAEQLVALQKINAQAQAPQEQPGIMESVGRKLVEGYGKAANVLTALPAMMSSLSARSLLKEYQQHPDDQTLLAGAVRQLQLGKDMGDVSKTNQDFYKGIGDKSSIQGLPGSFLEGAGGAATLGLNPSGLAFGGAGNVGSQVSADLLGDNALSRIVGALAGGVAAGGIGGIAKKAVSTISPNAANIGREMLEGLSPDMLAKAQAFQKKAWNGGLPGGVQVDLAQALEATGAPAGNVTAVRNFLAQRRQGDQTQATLRNQPGQLSVAADSFSGGLPGENLGQQVAANDLQKAATATVNSAKGERAAAVRPLYEQAGNLQSQVRKDFADQISESMTQPGVTADAKSAMQDALEKLKAAPSSDAAMTHALDFDTLISDLSGKFKGTPLSPADPKTSGQIKNLAGKLNETLQAASPELKAAEQRFAQISQDVIDPLKQGPVGQLATQKGYQPDVSAAATKFQALMAKGTDPSAKVSDIRELGTQLAKVDPTAVPNAVKSYVSMKIKQSMEAGVDASTSANNPDMAQKIASNLFANEAQYQGLKDALSVSAKGLGQQPVDVINGLNHLRQLTKALSSRPDTVGGISAADLSQLGGASKLASSARMFGMMPFQHIARGIENATLGKTLTQLDTIMTSPEGAAMLAALGRTPRGSQKTMEVLANWEQGSQANPVGLPSSNPITNQPQ